MFLPFVTIFFKNHVLLRNKCPICQWHLIQLKQIRWLNVFFLNYNPTSIPSENRPIKSGPFNCDVMGETGCMEIVFTSQKDRKIYKHSISKGVLQVKKKATSEVQINKIEILCLMFLCRHVLISRLSNWKVRN